MAPGSSIDYFGQPRDLLHPATSKPPPSSAPDSSIVKSHPTPIYPCTLTTMFSPAYDIGRPLDTTPTSPRSRRSIALPKLRTRRLSSGSPAREPTLLTAPVSLRPCDASYYDCLPHVHATLKSLVDKKGYRIEAILAEDKVFVSPPNKNRQWEEEVWDLAPEEETVSFSSLFVHQHVSSGRNAR